MGPSVGIDAGDQMWVSRYLLLRICELYNVEVTFDPKPIPGDWNGAGGHVNYSNNDTRREGAWPYEPGCLCSLPFAPACGA